MTWIPALVMGVFEPLVRSVTDNVCVPTVFRCTVNWRKPFVKSPLWFVAPSLDVTRTLSPEATGFQ